MNESNSIQHYPCMKDKSNTVKAKNSGFGWSSGNWSGYALSGAKGAYHSISGEWRVPFIKPSAKSAYSSAWIGIDGFRNSSLIQTGTGHEWVNGTPHYYAWWEILPASETVIPLPVSPGDRMRASIVKLKRNKWCITLRNLTRQWKFRTVQHYSGPQASVEWILEAPQIGGNITKLARLTPTRFSCCKVNGRNTKLTPSDGGIMIQNSIIVSVPSCPSRSGNAFIIKQLQDKIRPLVYSKSPVQLRLTR
ncbi:G1 family glutamic endopeptidase [Paenibacillus sp. sgz500958]|uniref:G1 family glutamic endopeptidase n=1 Tax=Paenibacillus sp. sgz500958 TaxID=3242475 RepID=UPI0036D2857E